MPDSRKTVNALRASLELAMGQVRLGKKDLASFRETAAAAAAVDARYREIQEQLSLALNTAQMGTWQINLKTKRMTTSEGTAAIFGVAKIDEDVFDLIDRLMHPEDRDSVQEVWQNAILKCTPYFHEYRLIRPDGSVRWIFSRGTTKIGEDGLPAYFSGVLGDITERKEVEALLASERLQLQKTILDLQQERELRERFVAALTHDLRTPMSSAKMAAQLLSRKYDQLPDVLRVSARIVASVNRADRMIQDLLDANHLRAGEGIQVNVSTCNLTEIVRSIVQDFTLSHGDRFSFKCPEADIIGECDSDAILRITENLMNNAMKYGSKESSITVSLSGTGKEVVLSVHNAGNPISAADQKILFHPFRRTDSAQTGGQKGWGIGLTLVRGLTEAHGGTIDVESNSEDGTTFSISLPKSKLKKAK